MLPQLMGSMVILCVMNGDVEEYWIICSAMICHIRDK